MDDNDSLKIYLTLKPPMAKEVRDAANASAMSPQEWVKMAISNELKFSKPNPAIQAILEYVSK